jgi:diguanylate cyclase (GGDEF)-like protein/PAS domain S-box-containing protein
MKDSIATATPVELSQLSELKSAALEAAANAIVITDREGAILWVNTAFEQLTGYSGQEVIGQSTRLLKSGLHPDSFYKNLWHTILAGNQWRGELTNRRKDGTFYAEEMAISPVRNPSTEITHFVAVKQDVTGRKRSEEATHRSETRFRTLFDSTSDAVMLLDEKGFFDCNKAALVIYGCPTREEFCSRHPADLSPPTQPCGTDSLTLANQCIATAMGKGSNHFEWVHKRADTGEIFPADVLLTAMELDSKPVVQAVVRDITERKRAEQKLRASEEQFRQLAENIREVFFILTPDPVKFAYISPAYDEIWGRPRQELYERPAAWIESVHPEDRERVGCIYAENMQGVQTEMEYRLMRPDGSVRWIDARSFPVRDSQGKFIRAVGIAEDITVRRLKEKNLEEAHQKLNSALAEAEQLAQEAAGLTELLDILQSCQTAEEAYKITEGVLPSALSARSGALCITSSSRNIVEAVAIWGDGPATEKAFRPDDCWALRRGKVHRVEDSRSSLRCAHVGGAPPNGYLCVPLAAQGETLGVLYLEYPDSSAAPSSVPPEDEMRVLDRQASAVGEQISLALANLRLREELRGQSLRDPLTGLFNRRYMEESLERELRRAVRNNQPVALLMLDIDHFKRFNDTFGHQAGDTLLRALGDFLIQRTRGQDAACRYGGEEFALILSGASSDAACKRAELLREDLKHLTVQHAGQVLGSVTLSIGVSSFPGHDTPEELLKAADEALYRAKAEGRGRVVVG